jgi:pyrroloquinoline quinone biosynthesis protein D
MSRLKKEDIFKLAPGFRLQWEEAQDNHVLLYPEGMVKINPSAAAILSELDGIKTIAEVANHLVETYHDDSIIDDVYEFMEVANEHGWIKRK